MAKIISTEHFRPVFCEFCGTLYEFEPGRDTIHILSDENAMRTAKGDFVGTTTMMLKCPVCGMGNKLERSNQK